MSVYLRDIGAYDPDEFSANIKAIIDSAIRGVPMKDLFDEESCFYDNLLSEVSDILYQFCDEVADEVWDLGEESGRDSGYDAGYESGYEYAREEYDNTSDIENLEEAASALQSEIEEKDQEIEELQVELAECRSATVLPEVDIDDLRQAIKADLMAEMADDTDDEDDY